MDLQRPRELIKVKHQPDTGYLTSMALGGNRMIISQGLVSLWE